MQVQSNTITVNAADIADIIYWYGERMADLQKWREAVAETAIRVQRDKIDRSYLVNAKRAYQYATEDMKETLEKMRQMGIKPRMEMWVSDLMA